MHNDNASATARRNFLKSAATGILGAGAIGVGPGVKIYTSYRLGPECRAHLGGLREADQRACRRGSRGGKYDPIFDRLNADQVSLKDLAGVAPMVQGIREAARISISASGPGTARPPPGPFPSGPA